MPIIKHDSAKTIFSGCLFEIKKIDITIHDKDKQIKQQREIAIRPPGVRAIIDDGKNILLIKEYRMEHNDWDIRLPGGKVFDTLSDFNDTGAVTDTILLNALERELFEEVGIKAIKPEAFETTKAGASISWDLHYFVITNFLENPNGPSPEEGEIIRPTWVQKNDISELIISRQFKEDRSTGPLLRYLNSSAR